MLKGFLLTLLLATIPASASEPDSLYRLEAFKEPAAVVFVLHISDKVKWSQEYPAKLKLSAPEPNVKLVKKVYSKEDFVVEGLRTSVTVPIEVFPPAELTAEIRFALCNKVSCYPQKARVNVRF